MTVTAPSMGFGVLSPPPHPHPQRFSALFQAGSVESREGQPLVREHPSRSSAPISTSPDPGPLRPTLFPHFASNFSKLTLCGPRACSQGDWDGAVGGWEGGRPRAAGPQLPLAPGAPPHGAAGEAGRRGAARKSHTPSGGGRGDIPNQSLIHKSTLGLVAAARARTHTRARPATASWGCGWPLGGDDPACLRLARPHPSRPAGRSPQPALPS